jgi:sarcosine oxidase subunit beta
MHLVIMKTGKELGETLLPKKEYDAVIIGGGGHGLATAYYLAKKHNMKNIAVVEKGWIGGGNTGRNTTIIRSNYLWDASAGLYDHALKIWEGLSQELNYNVMFSPKRCNESCSQSSRC